MTLFRQFYYYTYYISSHILTNTFFMHRFSGKALFIIADISGYTKFMIANKSTISRSQMIIVELIKTIIEHLHMPLKIAKLEGDAVFLYALKDTDDKEWDSLRCCIGEKLISFFDIFSERIQELSNSILCEGDSCKIIDRLRVKIIVHFGNADVIEIGEFKEISGIDVILVHRLLKNTLKANEYILMTEEGFKEIMFPQIICITRGTEHYSDIGEVHTLAYFPSDVTIS